MLKTKLPPDSGSGCLTIFHKQVFDCWGLVHGKECCNVKEISSEFIFDTFLYICSDKKPLEFKYCKIPKNISDGSY